MPNDFIAKIDNYINIGKFDEAEKLCLSLLENINSNEKKKDDCLPVLYNVASFLVDIGHGTRKKELSKMGHDIIAENKIEFIRITTPGNYYYNLANAKTNLLTEENSFNLTFNNIEELVEAKNYYWKSLKEYQRQGDLKLEVQVNLANMLKRQFRLSEAIRYYDIVNSKSLDISQSHANRSDSLKMLNIVSNSYSLKMIEEVAKGYKIASESKNIPHSWADYYKAQFKENESKLSDYNLDKNDNESTDEEFKQLSSYRKFCVNKYLSLSEHALYCSCAASARDNLTIPLTQKKIKGEFVPKMEMVLNRIKSEYSLARKNYYDYFNPPDDISSLLHEDCFTELGNSEILGISIEKLRTSFRLCFGILDKIAIAICELYNIPKKGSVYFHNFWRLDSDNRRELFESIRNPGLLALYSIATDLNMYKNGEWSCFKDWRNALEHNFFVVLDKENNIDPYRSLSYIKESEIVYLDDFIFFLMELLQITRSAIFSFVFTIRCHALEQTDCSVGIPCSFERKNFLDDSYK